METGCVAGRVKQRQGAGRGQLQQLLGCLGAGGELGLVAARKLGPPGRAIAEPAPELGRGRDLLEPEVYAGVGLLEAPRPEPIHEHAGAVVGLGRGVNAFHAISIRKSPLSGASWLRGQDSNLRPVG